MTLHSSTRTILALGALISSIGAASRAVAAEPSPAPAVHAVIVASNTAPDPSLAPLRYADDDGARWYELFSAYADDVTLLSVLDAETQRLHRDVVGHTEPPTWAALHDRLDRTFAAMARERAAGRPVVFYFVFAGHGGVGDAREGFVWLQDRRLTRTMLLRDVIGASPATTNHVIIDACDAYFMVNSRGGKSDRVGEDHADLLAALGAEDSLARYPNTGVILSTAAAQEAHEWSAWQAGVFSHELRSALVGAADVNGDGRIEYSEVKAFVAAANARIDDPRARLSVYAQPPRANLATPLFDEARFRAGAVLALGPSDGGKYYLEDARGVRYADFNKAPEAALRIALVPSPYYFIRGERDEAQIPAEHRGVAKLGELAWGRVTVASRGSTSETFRRDLYEVPYGPRFYYGFVASSGDLPVREAAGVTLAPPAPSRWGFLAEPRFVALEAAVALAAGAGVSGLFAKGAYDDFQDRFRRTGIRDRGLESRFDDRKLATNVLAGAALAAGAVSGVLFWTHRDVAPVVAPAPVGGGLGLTITLQR